MKLSVEIHTLHKRYGDEKAIQMLRKAGFDSIDYSFYWLDESDEALGENYREYAAKVRKILEENGMTCNQAHAPFDLAWGSSFDTSEKEYEKIVRSMEAAAIMGADSIVVHALGKPTERDFFQYNLAFYKSLEKYCEQFGICVAIENLFYYDAKRKCHLGKLHTSELLNGMIHELKSPWFVVCIDVGHAALTGYEPEDLISHLDCDTLKALHIHDNDYMSDRHVIPYAGSMNWTNIMEALKSIGYSGDLTLEIFGYLNHINDDFMADALEFAAKTGRNLMNK